MNCNKLTVLANDLLPNIPSMQDIFQNVYIASLEGHVFNFLERQKLLNKNTCVSQSRIKSSVLKMNLLFLGFEKFLFFTVWKVNERPRVGLFTGDFKEFSGVVCDKTSPRLIGFPVLLHYLVEYDAKKGTVE